MLQADTTHRFVHVRLSHTVAALGLVCETCKARRTSASSYSASTSERHLLRAHSL